MRILTLNIWGVPYAKYRITRLNLIAEKTIELAPDVICFQEVYLPQCPQIMIDNLKTHYPYYHFFASGVVGSGLLTMSKFPIVSADFHRFRLGGKPFDFEHGDYYAGKGIGLTRIQTENGVVDVYNCHTHAQYEPQNDNEYSVYTNTNLFEAIQFMNRSPNDIPTILCGDLNTRPDQPGYQIATQLGNLTDSYHSGHQKFPITYSAANPYTSDFNQCLDYIMVRNAAIHSVELAMTESPPRNAPAYSDHYGVIANLDFDAVVNSNENSSNTLPILEALLQEAKLELLETENQQAQQFERIFLGIGAIIDANLLANFLGRYVGWLSHRIRKFATIGGIGLSIYSIVQALLNLQSRKAVLQSLESEIQHQIDAKKQS